MKNPSIVDLLIENIKTDQNLLADTEIKVVEAKEKKKAIVERLKDYRKEIVVILKYVDDKQKAQIQELGFNFSESEQGLNPVASLVMDIIMKAKDNQLTNEQLYNEYVKTFKKKEDAFNYTEFNIKCRTLFNSQRLLRTKSGEGNSSRADIISLNGRVLPQKQEKEEVPAKLNDKKNAQTSK